MEINTDRLISTFIELCEIPSPSAREGRVGDYIRRRVEGFGLEVAEDGAGQELGSDTGNLLIRYDRGQGERLFLLAHMDTVPVSEDDSVSVVVTGDRIHTGGRSVLGADDKAGVAAALEILALSVEHPEGARPLDVIFTIKEEQGAQGAAFFDVSAIPSRSGFNLDGETPVYTAIRQAPFKSRYRVVVYGKSAHAAVNPEDGINAVKILGSIIYRLPSGRLSEDSTANLGSIDGGGQTNIVPEQAELCGEIRSLAEESLNLLKREIEEISREEAALSGGRVDIFWEDLYRGYFVGEDELCIRLFIRACGEKGRDPVLKTSLGGGDSNTFNNRGRRNIVFGLGMRNIHSNEEYILKSDLSEAVTLLKDIVFH